jgi:cytochrome b involved in lipid metabolism
MKRFMYTCFVAFWSSIITMSVSAALGAGGATGAADSERIISAEELAGHAAPDDCWMAIDGVVYDFSEYIPQHPAPPVVMTSWCGKEASEAYHTKGYGRDHSPAADAMLPAYRVGVLAGPGAD